MAGVDADTLLDMFGLRPITMRRLVERLRDACTHLPRQGPPAAAGSGAARSRGRPRRFPFDEARIDATPEQVALATLGVREHVGLDA